MNPKTTLPKSGSLQKPDWFENGVRFECQGSGKCCVSHGEFGFVYLTLEDRQRIAKLLNLSTAAFTRKHCGKTDGVYHLKDNDNIAVKEDCRFLANKRCSIYEARPVQCRTWPFWPEVMNAKVWAKEVAAFCPGVGKGSYVNARDIRATLEQQKKWEDDLVHGR